MSTKELCMQMIQNVPEYKIGYVLAFLQGLTADEAAEDDFCERLVDAYEADPEKDVAFTLEECKREWGLG